SAGGPRPQHVSRSRWSVKIRSLYTCHTAADRGMCLAHCGHDAYGVEVRVWRSQQRLECANLLALLLAARTDPQRVGLCSRKTAATSRRTPNAGATAKQPRLCR